MLLTAVFLAGWTYQVSASDYAVHAKVPAPALTEPAAILSPTTGTNFQSVPITVTGTCPLKSYVKLYRNDFFSGVALCDAGGNFSIKTDLFIGANQLLPRVFNITDDEGPAAQPVTVFYAPPQPAGSTGKSSPAQVPSSGLPQPSVSELLLTSDYAYKGYEVGQPVAWQLGIHGGVAPYAVSIEWGDGTTSLASRAQEGTFTVSHTYAKPKSGSYTLAISATDAAGHTSSLQLVAVVSAGAAGAHGLPIITSLSGASTSFTHFLLYVWPVYTVALVVLISFWLGERRELDKLRPWLLLKRHRRA